MKTFTGIVLLVLLCATVTQAQTRRADSVKHFFIGSLAPFDQWPNSDSKKANQYFGLLGTSTVRYINLLPQDTELHLNAEWRNTWDVPTSEGAWDQPPAPDSIVTGGPSNSVLDVIVLGTVKFSSSLTDAKIIRFETERHTQMKDTAEYCGFFNHDSTGKNALVGRNIFDSHANAALFLKGTSRDAETSVSALELVHNRDSAGVFGDSLWSKYFLKSVYTPQYIWDQYPEGYGRNLIARFRVRVDSTVDTSSHPDLFSVLIRQGDSLVKVLDTTVKCDQWIKHRNSDYDTISLRFRSGIKADSITDFKLSWPGNVSMKMDYMEILTARLEGTDYSVRFHRGYGTTHTYSYEELTENDEAKLKELIHNLMAYKGKIQYVWTGEEFPLSDARIFKRTAKLLRDSSGGQMELLSIFHDSADAQLQTSYYGSFYRRGLPIGSVYSLEGVNRGWLDPTVYADPKLFVCGQAPFDWRTALPKRLATSDTTTLKNWELSHVPRSLDGSGNYLSQHYSRQTYLIQSQGMINNYVFGTRQSKRICLRSPDSIHQRFCGLMVGGASQGIIKNGSFYKLGFGSGIRSETSAELSVTAHLGVSGGASGFIIYALENPDSTGSSLNGGLMDQFGNHNTNVQSFTRIDTFHVTGELWMGWKERYETARTLFPRIRKYGDALLNAKYIGDWTAAEIPLSSLKDSLPFTDSSITAFNDSLQKDVFKISHTDGSVDTANRVFVHISMWLDKDSTAKANGKDTLLYITNMRTDDSYDTTAVPTTIDRRLITMQFKARHLVQDIIDTNGYLALDNQKIWTPYVGAGDSLRVLLLPGDGILVRLLPGPDSMKQMRVAMNYPKGTKDFNDYGRINFDKAVKGVKNPTIASQYSVPSSRYSYIGIKDADTVKLWQDSLLYLKVDNVEKTRAGKWRNQNWTRGNGGAGNIIFNYKEILGPSATRLPQISLDSVAHKIVIKTDLEGKSSNGKIRLKDPFLVDSATLKNVQDTLAKSSPFLPHVLNAGRGQGVDSEHYGGIFLLQNPTRNPFIPFYAINAFSTIIYTTNVSKDTLPSYVDWSFLEWATNDTTVSGDTLVWKTDPDSAKVLFSRNPGIVFGKDSAQYIARYKSHMAAYTESGTPSDSGNCCNNQRKLFYMGKDSVGMRMFRFVYSSGGRIFTTVGTRTGTGNGDIIWKPEQLLSSWNNTHSHYPSVGYHSQRPEQYHYVYEDDNNAKIKLAMLDSNSVIHAVNISDVSDYSFATPAISSTDFISDPIDAVAWATATDGVHIRVVSWAGGTPSLSNVIDVGVAKNAKYPTVWIDSCDTCSVNYSNTKLFVAWQQDTTLTLSYSCCDGSGQLIPHDSTITDVIAEIFYVKDSLHGTPSVVRFAGPNDVSRKLNTFSLQNQRPCITGEQLKPFGSAWTQVKLAYETLYSPDSIRRQGIEIANYVYGPGWTNTNFLTSADTTNPYWKPSIEESQYHHPDSAFGVHDNWYSVVHEIFKGIDIQHWAFDATTQRVTSNIFLNIQDPQIAMTPSKIDSDLYRMGMTPASSEPRWLVPGYSGTFKLGTNDSLWRYHTIMEKDTASSLLIESGIGELGVDDGTGMRQFDLQDREDAFKVDAKHSKEYFMQSKVFVLPAGGSFQYCYWIRPSDDALYIWRFDTLQYALDFYDTTGVFQSRLDRTMISNTGTRLFPTLRTVSIGGDTNQLGYVVFHRITGTLEDTAAIPQSIISSKRYSNTTDAFKRGAGNKPQVSGQSDITLTASPNPFKKEVNVYLKIPSSAPVTIEAFNALGNSMGYLCKGRVFSEGTHQLVWKPEKLPSGVYILRMTFGNEVVSARVVSME